MAVVISVLGTSVGALRGDHTMCPGVVAGRFPRRRAQAIHIATVHAYRCKHHWCIPKYLDVWHTDALTDLGGQWWQCMGRMPVDITGFMGTSGFPRMVRTKMAVEIAEPTQWKD